VAIFKGQLPHKRFNNPANATANKRITRMTSQPKEAGGGGLGGRAAASK